jgi:putative holliday junction resolvase
MGRILAVDYGTKRVGLAVSDGLQIIANPLDTILEKESVFYIKNYCEQNEVELILIGKPKRMNNEDSDVESAILTFIQKIKKELPNMKIQRVDERFTSKLALDAMIRGGMKKKERRNKGNLDKISATIILQSYLHKLL